MAGWSDWVRACQVIARDLADTLLEGADMSGKLSGEELLRLLRG